MLREYTVFNVDQCEGEFAVRKFQRVMMRTWMAEIDLTENCGLVRYAIFYSRAIVMQTPASLRS